jgi:hypothetical protein
MTPMSLYLILAPSHSFVSFRSLCPVYNVLSTPTHTIIVLSLTEAYVFTSEHFSLRFLYYFCLTDANEFFFISRRDGILAVSPRQVECLVSRNLPAVIQ